MVRRRAAVVLQSAWRRRAAVLRRSLKYGMQWRAIFGECAVRSDSRCCTEASSATWWDSSSRPGHPLPGISEPSVCRSRVGADLMTA